MTMILADNTFAGLTVLQIALVSLALLIITMNVWSGWQSGVVRQVLRIVAILSGYIVGYKIGPVIDPLVPDIASLGAAQTVVVSILTGFLTYVILRFVINLLFRKTKEQESFVMRLIYGIGGATIGLFFSAFFLVATMCGIRLLGTIVDAQFRVAERRHEPIPEGTRKTALEQFSKANLAISNGPLAAVVETIDPMPHWVYPTLKQISTMTADPVALEKFVKYPGTRQLLEHPSLKKLADDVTIKLLVQKKDYGALLQDPRVKDMLLDKSLHEKLKTFEFFKAMDFALKPGPATPTLPAPAPASTPVY